MSSMLGEAFVKVTSDTRAAEAGINQFTERLTGNGLVKGFAGETRDIKEAIVGVGIASAGAGKDMAQLIGAIAAGGAAGIAVNAAFLAIGSGIDFYKSEVEGAKRLTDEFRKSIDEMFSAYGQQKKFERLGDKLGTTEGRAENYGDQERAIGSQIDIADKRMAALRAELDKKYGSGWESIVGKGGELLGFNAQDRELAREIEQITASIKRLGEEKDRVSKLRIGEEQKSAAASLDFQKNLGVTAPQIASETGLPVEKVRAFEEQLHKAEQDAAKRRDERIKSGWSVGDAENQSAQEEAAARTGIFKQVEKEILAVKLANMKALLEAETAARKAQEQAQADRVRALNEALGFKSSGNKDVDAIEKEIGDRGNKIMAALSRQDLAPEMRAALENELGALVEEGDRRKQAAIDLADNQQLQQRIEDNVLVPNKKRIAELESIKTTKSQIETFDAWRNQTMTKGIDGQNSRQVELDLLKKQIAQGDEQIRLLKREADQNRNSMTLRVKA